LNVVLKTSDLNKNKSIFLFLKTNQDFLATLPMPYFVYFSRSLPTSSAENWLDTLV